MTNQINDRGLTQQELKNCPFCGGSARYITIHAYHRIICDNDEEPCNGDIYIDYDSKEDAYKHWNTRHQPANQEDCREAFEKYSGVKMSEIYLGGGVHAQWLAWQAAYQSRREVVGDGEPPEAMCDAARGILLGFEMGIYDAKTMLKHLQMGDYVIPPYLKTMKGHITKWEQAIIIYQAMQSAIIELSEPTKITGDE